VSAQEVRTSLTREPHYFCKADKVDNQVDRPMCGRQAVVFFEVARTHDTKVCGQPPEWTNGSNAPERASSGAGRRRRWEIEMDDGTVRAALKRHWDASDASDFKVEHEIYREDAVLDYPQSGERIRGRHNIQESRTVQPNKKRFTVRRIIGSGDLWVTEFILTYDGIPSYAVSIMEFREGLVASETQYFADRFDPGPSRAHLVERAG
jgi:hypothetical protein